jgi:hypothetical protein
MEQFALQDKTKVKIRELYKVLTSRRNQSSYKEFSGQSPGSSWISYWFADAALAWAAASRMS